MKKKQPKKCSLCTSVVPEDEYRYWIKCFIDSFKKYIDYDNLKDHLWILVVLSRKGPLLVELIQCEIEKVFDDKYNVHVVTEIALPFLSEILKPNSKILMIDDALYYGTTAKSVANEIIEFRNCFNHIDDKIYKIDTLTVVKSNNIVKNINDSINIYTPTEISISQSHYFIEELVDDFSSLQKQFEVEFPIIEYKVGNLVKSIEDILVGDFTKTYKDIYVYKVINAAQTSVNIVFPQKKNNSLFRKIRMLLDQTNHVLRIMPIVTEIIPSNLNYYDMMFYTDDERLKILWGQIYEHIGAFRASSDLMRNRQEKSLVALSNYIMSLYFYKEHKHVIEEVLQKSLNFENQGELNKLDLKYIVGKQELVDSIFDFYIYLRDNRVETPQLNIIERRNFVPYQVFENEKGAFSASDIEHMEYKNALMLDKCKNVYEILSVLFFNQDYILEKRSRYEYNPTAERLKFGYTFDALFEIVRQYDRGGSSEDDSIKMSRIHRWVDERIDRSSIVPQYIKDDKLNSWVRVFRPGENEDVQLSHITRFVLFVFQSIPDYMRYEWIKRSVFEYLLVVAYEKIYMDEKIINSELMEVILCDEGNNNKYLCIYYFEEEQTCKRKVIDYLIDMFVLEPLTIKSGDSEVMLRISPRMYDGDLMFGTTFSQQRMKEIAYVVSKEWEGLETCQRNVKDYE